MKKNIIFMGENNKFNVVEMEFNNDEKILNNYGYKKVGEIELFCGIEAWQITKILNNIEWNFEKTIKKDCKKNKIENSKNLDIADNLSYLLEKTICINEIIECIQWFCFKHIKKDDNIKDIMKFYNLYSMYFNSLKYICENFGTDIKKILKDL